MKDRKAGKESYKGRQGKLQTRAGKATNAGKEWHKANFKFKFWNSNSILKFKFKLKFQI
jgi:hypothetical protein